MIYRGQAARRRNNSTAGGAEKFKLKCFICIWIIFAFCFGKFVFADITSNLIESITRTLKGSVDYKAAIEVMGKAISGEKSFSDAVTEACTYAFLIREDDSKVEVVAKSVDAQKTEKDAADIMEEIPENATYEEIDIDIDFISPVSGDIISAFGYAYDSVSNSLRFNYGCDINAETQEVSSFASGKVYAVGESTIYGKYIIIIHDNGVKTLYSNLTEISVTGGTAVNIGDTIGTLESGTSLHFEMMVDGKYVDPELYIV